MSNAADHAGVTASLESVLSTDELSARPLRKPDHQAENNALLTIAARLSDSPQTALQAIAEVAQKICRAGSAGISLLSQRTGDLSWAAVAGAWKPLVGSGIPCPFGPCGVITDRAAAQLFTRPQRRYPTLAAIAPAIEEALFVPFSVAGKAVGTVWVLAHDTARKFDAEDARLLENLGRLAGAACLLCSERDGREEASQSLRDVNEQLVLSSLHQHELTEQAHRAEDIASESRDRLASKLTATQLLQETSTQLIGDNRDDTLYEKILDAAVIIMRSDYASLQAFDPERRSGVDRQLLAHRGLSQEAARFWEWVRATSESTCGVALRTRKRVIVADVRQCEFLAASDDLEMYLQTGIHAVQFSPLFSRDGRCLGMLSTYWRNPHQPAKDDLRLLDVLARQAADFIDRAQVQAALQESDKHFRALAEAIPVIVWTADASGSIDWYNKHWYDYTGQTPEEAAGWGWQRVHHPDDFPLVMEAWPRALASGEPLEMEFRLRRHDGVFEQFLTRVFPFRNEHGAVVRWYGSNSNIELQKAALLQSKRVAETLQGLFLPSTLPHTPQVRFDASYKAAEEDTRIGGDWFDATQLPDGRYLISVGDVMGHGLLAAVIGGRLRQAITDFAFGSDDPAAVLAAANRMLCFQHPDVYATAAVAFVDHDCTTLRYATAGHPPPLLAASRSVPAHALAHGGLPLGLDDDLRSVSRCAALPPGAVVAFYTDGLTEFARDVEIAERALSVAVAQVVGDTSVARPAVAVQRKVLGDAHATDDVALLIAQFEEVDEESLQNDPTAFTKTWRFHSSDAYSAHASRHEVVKFIQRFAADPSAIFIAELIIGELLANTVEHAPGLVDVRVDWSGEKPIVRVLDRGPGLVQLPSDSPPNAMDEHGRGLFLVKALAEEVSVLPSKGFGAEVRVVLPLSRPPPRLEARWQIASRRGPRTMISELQYSTDD